MSSYSVDSGKFSSLDYEVRVSKMLSSTCFTVNTTLVITTTLHRTIGGHGIISRRNTMDVVIIMVIMVTMIATTIMVMTFTDMTSMARKALEAMVVSVDHSRTLFMDWRQYRYKIG